MRIFPVVTHLRPESWEATHLPRLWSLIASEPGRHSAVTAAADADVFLFLGGDEPFRDGLRAPIRTHPLFRAAPERCFAWDLNDRPVGLLPGLYASLPSRHFAPRFEAYCYLVQPNPRIEDTYAEGRTPDVLFSFSGALNAPVRHALMGLREAPRGLILDTTSQIKWYDSAVGGDVMTRYAELLSRSQFVLCPRGVGTSSFRVFETMQMGRVPVILSDPWEPPSQIAWDAFSLRVPEAAVRDIPDILARYEARAAEMGALGRKVWEQHFAPEVQLERVGDAVERIQRRTSARDLGSSSWTSRALRYRAERLAGQTWEAAAAAKRAVLPRTSSRLA